MLKGTENTIISKVFVRLSFDPGVSGDYFCEPLAFSPTSLYLALGVKNYLGVTIKDLSFGLGHLFCTVYNYHIGKVGASLLRHPYTAVRRSGQVTGTASRNSCHLVEFSRSSYFSAGALRMSITGSQSWKTLFVLLCLFGDTVLIWSSG